MLGTFTLAELLPDLKEFVQAKGSAKVVFDIIDQVICHGVIISLRIYFSLNRSLILMHYHLRAKLLETLRATLSSQMSHLPIPRGSN